jgi:hypothetical protein
VQENPSGFMGHGQEVLDKTPQGTTEW